MYDALSSTIIQFGHVQIRHEFLPFERAGDSVSLAVSSNPAQIEIATVVLRNKAIILKTKKKKERKHAQICI